MYECASAFSFMTQPETVSVERRVLVDVSLLLANHLLKLHLISLAQPVLRAELDRENLRIVPVGSVQVLVALGTQLEVNRDEMRSTLLLGSRSRNLDSPGGGRLLALVCGCSDLGHIRISAHRIHRSVERVFDVVTLTVAIFTIASFTA